MDNEILRWLRAMSAGATATKKTDYLGKRRNAIGQAPVVAAAVASSMRLMFTCTPFPRCATKM